MHQAPSPVQAVYQFEGRLLVGSRLFACGRMDGKPDIEPPPGLAGTCRSASALDVDADARKYCMGDRAACALPRHGPPGLPSRRAIEGFHTRDARDQRSGRRHAGADHESTRTASACIRPGDCLTTWLSVTTPERIRLAQGRTTSNQVINNQSRTVI